MIKLCLYMVDVRHVVKWLISKKKLGTKLGTRLYLCYSYGRVYI